MQGDALVLLLFSFVNSDCGVGSHWVHPARDVCRLPLVRTGSVSIEYIRVKIVGEKETFKMLRETAILLLTHRCRKVFFYRWDLTV